MNTECVISKVIVESCPSLVFMGTATCPLIYGKNLMISSLFTINPYLLPDDDWSDEELSPIPIASRGLSPIANLLLPDKSGRVLGPVSNI